MDIFSNLRWKAAQLLTSGLSADEKAQLIFKLDVVATPDKVNAGDQNDNTIIDKDYDTQKTIGEAVAEARMAEAQRQQSKWDVEREFLLKNAEEAARARVESELLVQERRLAMMRWQKQLEAETVETDDGEATTSVSSTTVDAPTHPILGNCCCRHGLQENLPSFGKDAGYDSCMEETACVSSRSCQSHCCRQDEDATFGSSWNSGSSRGEFTYSIGCKDGLELREHMDSYVFVLLCCF